jgi:hypothetical protein
MPARRGETQHIQRLSAILMALSGEWTDHDTLIAAVGYNGTEESAGRMLRGDIESLRKLGFVIDRSPGRRDPHYRLTGNTHIERIAR